MNVPYINMDKTDILHDANESIEKLELDFDTIFKNTCTGYRPDKEGKSHGLTGADVERILAFNAFGRRDPIEYLQPWDEVVGQALKLEKQHREEDTHA